MVLYMRFYKFQNFQFFAQNQKVLAYDFSENCYFSSKTDRNSVFLDRVPHTLD
jgi:hypothetical protein